MPTTDTKWQPDTEDVRAAFVEAGERGRIRAWTPQEKVRRQELFDLWLEQHEWDEVVNYLMRLYTEAEEGSEVYTFLEAELRNLGAW